MKRIHSIILIQGAITIAALAFAIGIYKQTPLNVPFSLDQLKNTSEMIQLLHLDPPQAQKFELLNVSLLTQLQGSCQRNCAARQELIRSDPTDNDAHQAILEKMCKAYEDSERATLDHVQAVRALLDEEQRTKLDQLLGRCLCGGCEKGCQ